MRILHISDLHIGKKLEGKSRLDEQKAVLDNIVSIADERRVQLVLIAGDVFDTFIPSSEAEELFFETIAKLTDGKRPVIIVSGNHDDPLRLCASKSISRLSDVYFADDKNVRFNSEKLSLGAKIESSGNGWFVVSTENEKVFVGALSYPTELRLKEKIDESEDYSQKVSRWINEIFSNNDEHLPQILVSHLFMLGGQKGEGERNIELGGARILEKNVIPSECIYTALGHLHKRQTVDKERNIIYSGSILQYHFDEAGIEKGVNLFDVENGKVQNLEFIKLQGYKELFRVSATSLEEGIKLVNNLDGYVELSLTLDKPLDANEHKGFCKEYPNVFLRLKFKGGEVYSSDRRELGGKDLFVEYYKSKFGSQPDDELVDLFMKMLNLSEVENEAD